MKDFWRTYWALLFALATAACGAFVVSSMVSAQTAPIGNGGPALNCSDATLVCTGGFSVGLNLGSANAWTIKQTNTAQWQALGAGGANACSGTNYPATVYGLCLGANNGTTNIYAAIIGPQATDFNCTATCTVGDSARVRWVDSLATGANACDTWYAQAANAWDVGCRLVVGGEAKGQMLGQPTANSWTGTCASVSATFHCVTATIATHATSETALTCFQMDVTNHAFAVDANATLTDGAAYTFTSTIPNGFVGTTSTAPTTGDSAIWFCIKP